MRKSLIVLVLCLFVWAGCGQNEPVVTETPRPLSTNTVQLTPTAVPSNTPAPTEQLDSSGVVAEIIDPADPPYVWPAPIAPLPDLVRLDISDAQQDSWQALNQSTAPDRDDLQLALAYHSIPALEITRPASQPLEIGASETFNISQNRTNKIIPVEATLLGISDHAYFWFDGGPGSVRPSQTAVANVGTAFDEIYEQVETIFGKANLAEDGADRVHIVTTSPLVLCDVTLANTDSCGLAGYFNSRDSLPSSVNPNSNERSMFVMNADWFGTHFFLNVLGHEFRHLIEENYDPSGEGWEIEGSATLAEDLLGSSANAQQRANRFLRDTNLQLNSWSSSDKIPHYGQGYLFNRYIYDQLGSDLYREFVQHPANGLAALDAVVRKNKLPVTGDEMWLDWLAALAIHNHPNAPRLYRFGDAGLNNASASIIHTTPAIIKDDVAQYAANYYELPAGESLVVNFTGSTAVPVLPVLPVSGQGMWVAERGNYHNPRLTRIVDLTNVDEATLDYSAYVDMEHGYDFGYVAVSTDDGRSWQPLIAENMKGLHPSDDPAQAALADRFYTGRVQAWVQESIDLTPYAGQQIQLRFEYITDPATNYSGFALDNIAIPEIGFYDDVENVVDDWHAEGFTRATAYIPQTWHLQLITFPDGVPNVNQLPIDSGQTGAYLIESTDTEANPLLIIAASAPNTLEPGHYQLSITNNH